MTVKELYQLRDHVGCGDLDNHGMCEACQKIRRIIEQVIHDIVK